MGEQKNYVTGPNVFVDLFCVIGYRTSCRIVTNLNYIQGHSLWKGRDQEQSSPPEFSKLFYIPRENLKFGAVNKIPLTKSPGYAPDICDYMNTNTFKWQVGLIFFFYFKYYFIVIMFLSLDLVIELAVKIQQF